MNKEQIQESLLCLAGGLLLAIAFIALMLGDGNKGLLDLI